MGLSCRRSSSMENPCLCHCRLTEREEPRAGEWPTEPLFFLIILLASKVSQHLKIWEGRNEAISHNKLYPPFPHDLAGAGGGWGEEAWHLPGIEDLTMLTRKNMQKRLTKETKKNLLRFPAASRLCSSCPATASSRPWFHYKSCAWTHGQVCCGTPPKRLPAYRCHKFTIHFRATEDTFENKESPGQTEMTSGCHVASLLLSLTTHRQTQTHPKGHPLVTSRILWPA